MPTALPVLPNAFASRPARIAHLKALFPEAADSPDLEAIRPGGRKAALEVLSRVEPEAYARTRNFLDGKVTRLSAYIRHGVVSIAEIRDFALKAVPQTDRIEKFVNELGWRDFWQRIYYRIEDRIHEDIEPIKTGYRTRDYAPTLPAELVAGTTRLACIDGFSQELKRTGYLHNHSRMWLAAWLVHWKRVRWQAGAAWFLQHLLDGDPASNSLSWQWVASTFSHKPYFFNRENLEKFTGGRYCRGCPSADSCPFDATYEDLEKQLFRAGQPENRPAISLKVIDEDKPTAPTLRTPLLWVHDDDLNPESPLRRDYPDRPAVYVWSDAWMQREKPSLKRLLFIQECLEELNVEVYRGQPEAILPELAKQKGTDGILTTLTPDPSRRDAMESMAKLMRVEVVGPDPFLSREFPFDLARFSLYWNRASKYAFTPTADGGG